jgi:hypothetical protein
MICVDRVGSKEARHNPVWMPDGDLKSMCCAACHVNFNTAKRRHHCRYCGVIVCQDCSAQNLLLDRWLSDEAPHPLCIAGTAPPGAAMRAPILGRHPSTGEPLAERRVGEFPGPWPDAAVSKQILPGLACC